MVHWPNGWLAFGSADEYQSGCGFKDNDSCRNARPRIFLPEYPAIFTIPLGLLAGGAMVDKIFEPVMASAYSEGVLERCLAPERFRAAIVMFVLGITGTAICLIFGRILRKI